MSQKFLNFVQKLHLVQDIIEILNQVKNNPELLERVIPDDETSVYRYDVISKNKLPQ